MMLMDYYRREGRVLPWRLPGRDGLFDAYAILVSELMLQQTQVQRVIPKFQSFLRQFPTLQALSEATLADVLAAWAGLGYNRRARYLWEAASQLAAVHEPWTHEQLLALKGIGANTAAAILTYSYDVPTTFLETNIKTVLIQHFFTGRDSIPDKELYVQLESILPWNNGEHISPREYYWAMMDYGTHLKATVGNQNHRSRSFAKQSKFEGSRRQLRGRIIAALLKGPLPTMEVVRLMNDARTEDVIDTLVSEQLISVRGTDLILYNSHINHKHN